MEMRKKKFCGKFIAASVLLGAMLGMKGMARGILVRDSKMAEEPGMLVSGRVIFV
jgi:hypothetical protein